LDHFLHVNHKNRSTFLMKLMRREKELHERPTMKDVKDLSAAEIHDIYDEIVCNNALVVYHAFVTKLSEARATGSAK
jgi:hypothetical protein